MKKPIFIYFLIVTLDSISFGLIAPIVAPLLTQAHIFFSTFSSQFFSYLFYGLLLSSFHLSFMMGAPLFGILSDHFGRKKILLTCLYLTLIAFSFYIVAFIQNSIFFLVIARVLSGLSAGSQSVAQAAIVKHSKQYNKPTVISFIAVGMTMGLVVGPLLSSLWSVSMLWLPFVIVLLLTTLNIFMLTIFLNEEKISRKEDIAESNYKNILKNNEVRRLLVIFFFFELGWSLFYQALPLWINLQWHIKNPKLGLVQSYVGIILVMSLCFAAKIALKFISPNRLIATGFIVGVIALISLYFQTEFSVFLLTVLPIVLTVAFVYPRLVSSLSDISSDKQQGLIMGMTNALLALSFSITGLFSSILTFFNISLPFIVAAIFWITANIIYIKSYRKLRLCNSVLT
ncbi:MAG TPA: MFS transporter [Gammaproteobacteria bacterium]|nr:MFS transporter [Gammaproteobacteria bacterium]